MAIEYARLFASNHLAINDDLFARLHEHYSDAEILDLSVCTARFLGFGRLTQVLGVDAACAIDHG